VVVLSAPAYGGGRFIRHPYDVRPHIEAPHGYGADLNSLHSSPAESAAAIAKREYEATLPKQPDLTAKTSTIHEDEIKHPPEWECLVRELGLDGLYHLVVKPCRNPQGSPP